MLRLLKGIFGTVEAYALLDFEAVPIGDLTGTVQLGGEVDAGNCRFETAQFGSRT